MTSSVDPTSRLSLRCNVAIRQEGGGDGFDIRTCLTEDMLQTPAQTHYTAVLRILGIYEGRILGYYAVTMQCYADFV